MTGGNLVFNPIGSANVGKPGVGKIQSDGSFVMGTYRSGDGAVIGTHRIMFSPPQTELPPGTELKPGEGLPPSRFDGLVPKESHVQVTKGGANFTIELVPDPTAARKPIGRAPGQ